MTRQARKITDERKRRAEEQIEAAAKLVKFNITEYSVEALAEKVRNKEYYIPDYQRALTWKPHHQSRFIESVLIGLPIPFLFFWQDADGRFEIVDGSQRLRTLREFVDDELALSKLDLLTEVNGFRFSDLDRSRQRRFQSRSIRGIILEDETSAATRTEMFSRINTSGLKANEAEIRRGALPGPITDLITELSEHELFKEMTPITKTQVNLREREELVARFLTYTSLFQPEAGGPFLPGYKDRPKNFIYKFIEGTNAESNKNPKIIAELRDLFLKTLEFIRRTFPNGFMKPTGITQVPRTRFEAIAIGSALALKDKPNLNDQAPEVNDWLESDDFLTVTTSDGANVRSKLEGRINFVRMKLVGAAE